MTDNLPAVPDRPDNSPVRVADTDSWSQVVGEVAKLAGYIGDTEFVPKGLRGRPAAAAAAILYGREVGLPPMTALTQTHVIEGKPGIAAEAMRAMVYAAGHEIEFVESTGALCKMRGRRRGQENWTTVQWTIDMARAAGLLGKSNWKSYPRQQLQARATTELCRMIFADIIHGFRSVEELQDVDDDEASDPGVGFGQQAGSSTVQRQPRKRAAVKKTAAKTAAPAPDARPPSRPALGSVPLPGEPGFDGAETPTADTDAASPAPEPSDPSNSAAEQGDPEASQADTLGQAEPSGSPDQDDEEPVDAEIVGEEAPPAAATKPQMRALHATFGERFDAKGDAHRDYRLAAVSTIVGRDVETTSDLTRDEMSGLFDTLARCKDREQLDELLAGVREAEQS